MSRFSLIIIEKKKKYENWRKKILGHLVKFCKMFYQLIFRNFHESGKKSGKTFSPVFFANFFRQSTPRLYNILAQNDLKLAQDGKNDPKLANNCIKITLKTPNPILYLFQQSMC